MAKRSKGQAFFEFPALRVTQNGATIYLTAIAAKMLDAMATQGVLFVDRFAKRDGGAFSGYQRILNEKRVGQLRRFLLGKAGTAGIIRPILPQSVFLNVRPDSERPAFEADGDAGSGVASGTVRIFDRTRLVQVDGQHRIRGLIEAATNTESLTEFMLPVSIVDGLTLSQEAAQFLTINRTQKKVDADLELRVVYHRDREECNRLANALGFEEWRIKALVITIQLNDSVPSPWENAISRPGEGKRRGISEKAFVLSLESVCARTRPIGREDPAIVGQFLKDFWAVIAEEYPTAWSEDQRRLFRLRKTLGVNAMHLLAPAVFDLCRVWRDDLSRDSIADVLAPVFRAYRERDWREGEGRFTQLGSGMDASRKAGQMLIERLIPGYKHEASQFRKLEKIGGWVRKCLVKARNMLNPLNLRRFDQETVRSLAPGRAGGAYVLVALNNRTGGPRRLYVGKSETDLGKRISDHFDDKEDWDLFYAELANDEKRCAAMEGALCHLAPHSVARNKIHPSNCVFCER